MNRHRTTRRRSRWLPAALVLAAAAALALAAICGSVEQEAPDETATPSETVLVPDTAAADALTATTASATEPPARTVTPAALATVERLGTGSTPPMTIIAEVWKNAEPISGEVRVLIGGVECARQSAGLTPDAYIPTVLLTVPPEEDLAGCGAPGARLTFEIDGTPANQVIAWDRSAAVGLRLTAGSEPTIYKGFLTHTEYPIGLRVEPRIEGIACGRQLNQFLGSGPVYTFVVLVLPDEIKLGCGQAGATVTMWAYVQGPVSRDRTEIGKIEGAEAQWAPGQRTTLPPPSVGFGTADE